MTVISLVTGALQSPKVGTRTGGLGSKRTSRDHYNYSIVEISQNTEKSLGDLRRLAVIQTPVRNHWLTLVRKTRKGVNNNNNNNNNNNYLSRG